MSRYDVICLDLFQTLVNVDSRREQIWRAYLKEAYTKELGDHHAELMLKGFFRHWAAAQASGGFQLMTDVYGPNLKEHFRIHELQVDPEEALDILFREHRLSEMYPETEAFLNRLTREYPVCIVSDADNAMVPDIVERYPVRLLTSEDYRSYKNDRNNIMFRTVLQEYGVDASRVIHVGDSASDVLGAKREGITACWLNREGNSWDRDPRPDWNISYLDGLWPILEGRKNME